MLPGESVMPDITVICDGLFAFAFNYFVVYRVDPLYLDGNQAGLFDTKPVIEKSGRAQANG